MTFGTLRAMGWGQRSVPKCADTVHYRPLPIASEPPRRSEDCQLGDSAVIWTRTHCEACGSVTLAGDRYFVGVDGASDVCYYRFDCPGCGRANRRGASSRVVTILMCLGAQTAVDSAASPITEAGVTEFSGGCVDDCRTDQGMPA